MKKFTILFLLLGIFTIACQQKKDCCSSNVELPKYQADWVSLRQHQTPKWLIDAKFGIYCHWGIQTLRYQPDKEEFPNDTLIDLFTGENFKADEWAELFETAGAKFGGVIGWHGSEFKHWDSQLSDYNSAKMGPHIDIVGEVSKAVRKRGMKFLVSFHSFRYNDWMGFGDEVINKYQPDIFWVDASFGGTKAAHNQKSVQYSKYTGEADQDMPLTSDFKQRTFIANFFNMAIDNNKEVEFVYKSNDIPPGVGMRDLENGILNKLAYDVWMTDMDMNVPPDWAMHGWFYREGIPLRSANDLVDMLVDVVSKNGIFLMNIPPLADGSFPQEVRNNLTELGSWLKQNGEAIYGTSPWFLYGEGTSEIPEGNYTFHHNNHFSQISYTDQDIRFTVKGNNLYATCLGKPSEELRIRALNSSFKLHEGDIQSVTYLGTGESVDYIHNEKALVLELDNLSLDEKANVFKIELANN